MHPKPFPPRVSSLGLVAGVVLFIVGFAAPATAQTAAGPARAAASANLVSDPGWPREVTKDGMKFVYYEPQIDEWKNQRELRARIAFSLTPKTGDPIVGVAEFQGNTVADLDHRTVFINPLTITSVRFPSLPDAQEAEMSAKVKALFPAKVMTVSLDRMLALASESAAAVKPVQLKADAPVIFSSPDPAILLVVDGKPVLAPIEGTDLQFMVNTTWDVFFCTTDSKYYLVTQRGWLTAAALDGDWTVAVTLPAGFKKLPADEQWNHIRKAMPPKVTKAKPPRVFFSEKPAELIAFAGQPVYKAIAGTKLLFATNTESWAFFDKTDGQLYFLTSGRWFRSPKWDGPWTYAGNNLPADFAKIPENSEAAEVLASVPGTPEAADAILLAQIPTTAKVDRKKAAAEVKVQYDGGKPEFKPIQGTTMQYATNAAGSDVVLVAGKYYALVNAVWFVADGPEGPWAVATSVPPEVYTIPPDSPVYRTTYVTIDSFTDEYVETSYTSGYLGSFVAGVGVGSALWWGTGWYYPPYVYWGGGYPIYRPYWGTYGRGAYYNSLTGGYAVGGYAYGPYGAAGRAAWYNPNTGRYGRAATVQGPYGGRTTAGFYNPTTGTAGVTRQGSGPYAQWGSSTVTRGSDTIHSSHIKGSEGGIAHASGPNNSATIAKGPGGNVYAGKDGNVYKRDSAGNWSPVGGNTATQNKAGQAAAQNRVAQQPAAANRAAGASAAARPATGNVQQRPSSSTVNSLNNEAAARQRATQNTQRSQNYSNYNRTPSPSYSSAQRPSNFGGYHPGASGGGYRGGGGGYRGGGGGGGRRR